MFLAIGPATAQPDACKPGFVWRPATPEDRVCVLPIAHLGVVQQNDDAAKHVMPAGDTCRPGYVWREATPQDHVCVKPGGRDQVQADNSAAPLRVLGAP